MRAYRTPRPDRIDALKEPEDWLVALRDASFHASHGRASKYHVLTEDGTSACDSQCLLMDDNTMSILETPAHMCCTRNGCRQIFLAVIS